MIVGLVVLSTAQSNECMFQCKCIIIKTNVLRRLGKIIVAFNKSLLWITTKKKKDIISSILDLVYFYNLGELR